MQKMPQINSIIQGDTLEILKTFPNNFISCVMTSPPYWALRDYSLEPQIWDADVNCQHEWIKSKVPPTKLGMSGNDNLIYKKSNVDKCSIGDLCKFCNAWKGQLGLEPTFDLYIKHLCDIFDEIKRVLRKDGTIWVNIGDTYSATRYTGKGEGQPINKFKDGHRDINPKKETDLEDKNLCLIPFRFAIEMQNRGWILRNVIIWYKRNCMPSSVKDRFTVDFEYLFFFVKNKKYWFETQYEEAITGAEVEQGIVKGKRFGAYAQATTPVSGFGERILRNSEFGRNKRCVWDITLKPFPEAHFAVYSEELCETPIKAGCPEFICKKCGKPREKIISAKGDNIGKSWHDHSNDLQKGMCGRGGIPDGEYWREDKGYSDCNCNAGFESGIVLDPFIGSGTTGLVALKQNKRFIGIELQPKYIEIAMRRLKPYLEQTKLT